MAPHPPPWPRFFSALCGGATPTDVEVGGGPLGVFLTVYKAARPLNLSAPTVRRHASNLLGKLQPATRIQAALSYALREGMVTLDASAGRDPERDGGGKWQLGV
jgi:hypothetical protein